MKPLDLPFPPPPGERFACASIDWPSHFQVRGKVDPADDRSPQKHYATASLEHMMTLPVRDFLTRDAFVFLWMTGPHTAIGNHVRLADAWGLEISSLVFVWLKTLRSFDMAQLEVAPVICEADLHMGGGYTSRANAELVFLLRKGNPQRLRADVRQVIFAPVADHSRKPDEFFRRAEAFCPGPRIDMFAGRHRPGWTRWGHAHRPTDLEAAE